MSRPEIPKNISEYIGVVEDVIDGWQDRGVIKSIKVPAAALSFPAEDAVQIAINEPPLSEDLIRAHLK